MATKIVYFVHGTTTDNELDLATGWRAGELSATGREQARVLGGQVADKRFVEYLQTNFDGKQIAIVAHQGPQLALDVLLRGKTWHQAIEEDWRKQKAWRPGWEYTVD